MKRECTITVRVSVEEREKLRLEAESRDISMGWLVRERVYGRCKRADQGEVKARGAGDGEES